MRGRVRRQQRAGGKDKPPALWKKGEKKQWWLEQVAARETWQESGFHRRFGDNLIVKGNSDIEEVVLRVRVLAGVLATRVSPQRGTVEEGETGCRLCGARVENNHHVMWECTGSPLVVMTRRGLVRKLKTTWGSLGLEVDEVEVLAAVHSLNAGGSAVYGKWEELGDALGEMCEGVRIHEAKLTDILGEWMHGQGWKHAFRGDLCSGKWIELLGDMGIEREVAAMAVDKVSAVVVGGQCELWRTFSEHVREKERGGEDAVVDLGDM